MFDKKTYGIRISGTYVEVSEAVYISSPHSSLKTSYPTT